MVYTFPTFTVWQLIFLSSHGKDENPSPNSFDYLQRKSVSIIPAVCDFYVIVYNYIVTKIVTIRKLGYFNNRTMDVSGMLMV